jgi:hypothetical protein
MKRFFEIPAFAMIWVGLTVGGLYVFASIITNPWAMQFVLDYGFQLCICTVLVAMLIDKVGKRVPDGWTPLAEGFLFFYILGSILLSGCIFGLVFRSMWAESGWVLWALAFIFGLLSLVAAEHLRWQGNQQAKLAG